MPPSIQPARPRMLAAHTAAVAPHDDHLLWPPGSPPCFDGQSYPGTLGVAAGTNNTSTNAFRYVSPPFVQGRKRAMPMAMAMPGPQPHVQPQQFPFPTHRPSWAAPLVPYVKVLRRFGRRLPMHVLPVFSMLPNAWENWQKTQRGTAAVRYFFALRDALEVQLQLCGAPQIQTPPWLARQVAFKNNDTRGVQRVAAEAVFFLLFNVIDHITAALAALPIAMRVAGAAASGPWLSATLQLATPALMAVTGLVHLARHVWLLALSLRCVHALQQAPRQSAPTLRAHQWRLLQDSLDERQYRGVQVIGWALFNIGLLFASGLVVSHAPAPLFAAAVLALGIFASKAPEYIWRDRFDVSDAAIWPRLPGRATQASLHRRRCFADAERNERAYACLQEQKIALRHSEAALLQPLPPWQRRSLQTLLRWHHLPGAAQVLQLLAGRWLRPHVLQTSAHLAQAYAQIWQAQLRLLQDEQRVHPFAHSRGLPPESVAQMQAGPWLCARELMQEHQQLQRDGQHLQERIAVLPNFVAQQHYAPIWRAMFSTWNVQPPAQLIGPGDWAKHTGPLLLAGRMQIRDAQKSLVWAAKVEIFAHSEGALPGRIWWSATQTHVQRQVRDALLWPKQRVSRFFQCTRAGKMAMVNPAHCSRF